MTDSVVFSDMSITKDAVMSKLFIGARSPQDNSEVTILSSVLKVHRVGGIVDANTVFEVEHMGQTLFLKNLRSTVLLEGWVMSPQIYEAEDATISNAVSNIRSLLHFILLNIILS